MSGTNFTMVAYVLGLGLLWGYAAVLWAAWRRIVTRKEEIQP